MRILLFLVIFLTKNQNCDTPLHISSSKGFYDITKLLVERLTDEKISENLKIKNSNGNTPLLLACQRYYKDIIILLTENGSNLNTHNNKRKCAFDLIRNNISEAELVFGYEFEKEVKSAHNKYINKIRLKYKSAINCILKCNDISEIILSYMIINI